MVDERPGSLGKQPAEKPTSPEGESPHAQDIYTLANIITMLRLILVPIFFEMIISGRNDTLAFALFAVAASTDWLDGQIARRTGTVTEIGKAIDPLVDRLLIAFGVLGIYLQGRLPLWIVVVLFVRDGWLLAGAAVLARKQLPVQPVIFLGKMTTALLLFGFSGLILNWPQVAGLGLVDSPYLPGWGSASVAAPIWFVYAGLVTSLTTAVIYTVNAVRTLASAGTHAIGTSSEGSS